MSVVNRDENQQQTQPTCDAGSGNRTWGTAVGGECSHHCAIPTPQIEEKWRQQIIAVAEHEFSNIGGIFTFTGIV